MESYDLSTITREKLLFLLSTAKDEIAKYNRYNWEIERVRRTLGEARKEKNDSIRYLRNNKIFFIVFGVIIFMILTTGSLNKGPLQFYLLVLGGLGIILLLVIVNILKIKKELKIAEKNINKYEQLLPNLAKEEEKAMNEFKALLFIPNKYCSEEALTKMLEYVEDKEASNWERVTDLYKDYLYKQEMKGIARQTLEQSIIQTELANETRKSARWAAAGAWASAAGIWTRR